MKKLIVLLFVALFAGQLFAQKKPVDSYKDGKFIKVNNAKLWVVTVGTGDPVIFLAGGPGSAHIGLRDFDPIGAGTHQLIYFDGFGRGQSDTAKVVSEYSLQRDIEDVEGLRKALKLEKVSVLGHSYGGVIAQGYAIKYPQHVSHLILANTFHSYVMWQENDDNCNREIKTNYPEVWNDLMKIREKGGVSSDTDHQAVYGRVPYGFLYMYNPEKRGFNHSSEPYPNGFNTKLYYQMVGRDGDFYVGNDIGTFDFRKQLQDLKMPVLIIGGRFDRVATPWMMVKYKAYCPQAQFVMFEKSGHNPQVEEPEAEFELIRSFLKKK